MSGRHKRSADEGDEPPRKLRRGASDDLRVGARKSDFSPMRSREAPGSLTLERLPPVSAYAVDPDKIHYWRRMRRIYHTPHRQAPRCFWSGRPIVDPRVYPGWDSVSRLPLLATSLYFPVMRYENHSYFQQGQLRDYDRPNPKLIQKGLCGTYFFWDPNSTVLLDLGKCAVFASKVEAYVYLSAIHEGMKTGSRTPDQSVAVAKAQLENTMMANLNGTLSNSAMVIMSWDMPVDKVDPRKLRRNGPPFVVEMGDVTIEKRDYDGVFELIQEAGIQRCIEWIILFSIAVENRLFMRAPSTDLSDRGIVYLNHMETPSYFKRASIPPGRQSLAAAQGGDQVVGVNDFLVFPTYAKQLEKSKGANYYPRRKYLVHGLAPSIGPSWAEVASVPTHDDFDEAICVLAKALNLDTLILQHEPGETRATTEVVVLQDRPHLRLRSMVPDEDHVIMSTLPDSRTPRLTPATRRVSIEGDGDTMCTTVWFPLDDGVLHIDPKTGALVSAPARFGEDRLLHF